MTAVASVLLVPSEGDPHKLLGDPESAAWKLGARPPMAWLEETENLRWWHAGPPHPYTVMGGAVAATALVLMWEGRTLRKECDGIVPGHVKHYWDSANVLATAMSLAPRLGCDLVLLDEEGAVMESGEAQLPTTMEPFTVTLSRTPPCPGCDGSGVVHSMGSDNMDLVEFDCPECVP